jgi:protein gp37
VEDQKSAYERIPLLLDTPAAVRFVSCEPLLGPVYLDEIPQVLLSVTSTNRKDSYLVGKGRLDWVIAGGESGPKARPMHPDWVRGLRDQCLAGNIPFFFKSWGEWAQTYYNFLVVDKFGKKKASRLLDGVEWNEFPEIAVNE